MFERNFSYNHINFRYFNFNLLDELSSSESSRTIKLKASRESPQHIPKESVEHA